MPSRRRPRPLLDALLRPPAAGPAEEPDRVQTFTDWTAEEWLAMYRQWHAAGEYASEPDFALALDELEAALVDAHQQTDPPFVPPDDYLPTEDIRQRVSMWRGRHRGKFPAVRDALLWVLDLSGRVHDGVPPVTCAEFAELADWFQANHDRLYRVSGQLLDLGDGQRVDLPVVGAHMRAGPRRRHAGEFAQVVRLIRQRFGEVPT